MVLAVVHNRKEDSVKALSTARISDTRRIPSRSIRKVAKGPEHVSTFAVDGRLLQGAVVSLRRMLWVY